MDPRRICRELALTAITDTVVSQAWKAVELGNIGFAVEGSYILRRSSGSELAGSASALS